MPSVSEETAVLSTIEQMIWSKLVIVSDVGGWSEVLGSTGLKIAPGNTVEFAQLVREALEHRE